MTEELHSHKYDGEYEEEEDDGDGHCQEVHPSVCKDHCVALGLELWRTTRPLGPEPLI